MFTGIIETTGTVEKLEPKGTNLEVTIRSELARALKIDQSVSHNGVCLTVVKTNGDLHTVIAVEETLQKSNLGKLHLQDAVNLERCLQMNGRIDGHLVQGHVDQTGICRVIEDRNGSWIFTFDYTPLKNTITVEKGSICVNGVSLTVVNSTQNSFMVAVIPYTFEHTNFQFIKPGHVVNLEFDIIGKYVARIMEEKR